MTITSMLSYVTVQLCDCACVYKILCLCFYSLIPAMNLSVCISERVLSAERYRNKLTRRTSLVCFLIIDRFFYYSVNEAFVGSLHPPMCFFVFTSALPYSLFSYAVVLLWFNISLFLHFFLLMNSHYAANGIHLFNIF